MARFWVLLRAVCAAAFRTTAFLVEAAVLAPAGVFFFTAEAAAYLTKFVFYFALSAMLFRFAANLSLSEILDWWFVAAYLWGCFVVYAIATAVAFLRRRSIEEAAVEAQCAVIGNTGFLGVPMLFVLMGDFISRSGAAADLYRICERTLNHHRFIVNA